ECADMAKRLAAGEPAIEAIPEVHQKVGWRSNFGFLSQDETLLVYGGNPANAFWRFGLEGAQVAATQVHSDDLSLFDLLFDRADRRRQVIDRICEVGAAVDGPARADQGVCTQGTAG